MRAGLERRLGTILGVTAALAWLALELFVGLTGARNGSDPCDCEAREGPSELAGEAIDDPE
jgi:hypothetical protein